MFAPATSICIALSLLSAPADGAAAILHGVPFALVAQTQDAEDEYIPKLSVRGEAQLYKPADQLQISIGVVTEGTSATDVMTENSQSMNEVVKAIRKVGLTDDDYQTGRFQIRPTYAQRPRNPEPDWTPRITGYHVENSLNIRTTKLDLAGKLIEAANAAGANSIDRISFTLADSRKHQDEVIAMATRNAIEDAKSLANAASLELVRILSIQLNNAQSTPPQPMSPMMRTAAMESSPPPIAPGDVDIRANVTIVYEIDEAPGSVPPS